VSQSLMVGRRRRVLAALGATALILGLVGGPALAQEEEEGELVHPVDFIHNNLTEAPVPGGVFGSGPARKLGEPICSTPTQTGANVNTDCEGTGPHNETTIAVNPTNPLNMIAGANDYQLAINPGGSVSSSTESRAHVTIDGGHTWTTYPLDATSTYQATGDPAVAFDAAGNAYYATLGFRFVGPANALSPDIIVHVSKDGGVNWTTTRLAAGSGNFGSPGDLLDKEYVAAWGDGNAIVTYGDFRLGQKGSFISAKIYATVTHDAGATWTKPVVISGTFDESFVSVPTVSSDGRVFVAFLNTTDLTTGRDDYEVVEVNPATGARIAGPFKVATTIDGFTDYPFAFGRQTYEDSLFRSWAAGNITTDPTNPAHLAVVWSDMRNSQLPAPEDPYEADTNSDVIVSQSFDSGRTWSTASAIARTNDQFQPWGAYDTGGLLRIGFFDRAGDAANHTYGYTLATETAAGSLVFSLTELTTVRSDPTKNNRWFAGTVDPDFPFATTFIGDYSGIAATPAGGVVATWTDLRNDVTFAGRTGHGQDMYFAAAP
jgi:hypothetical protein